MNRITQMIIGVPVVIGSSIYLGSRLSGNEPEEPAELNQYHQDLGETVLKHMEMADGFPGITFHDYIDFCMRAGWPTYQRTEGDQPGLYDLREIQHTDVQTLNRVLESYQADGILTLQQFLSEEK